MFKVESILTPLLLSYVDKYVKNVAPRDSQVSLWEGEAVFHKLDLRLDVLEHELQLPFTFVNGHVHELRINVPWTKLGSEPIIVTVNTFECIMKLKDASEIQESRSDEAVFKNKPQRLEYEGAPPSFVQSLISRILMNMNIICNNVILKYVEGDIVMSINVKSAQLHTANSNWERAYIDTAQTDMIIRKLISLIDVTICLDQRDASGKIETYQDPLLYRSMIAGRAYIAYNDLTTRSPSVSRFDFKSDDMELSITDQQLPMLLRLAQLCSAVYFGDLVLTPPKIPTDMEKDAENSLSEGNDGEQTWGNWAWSLVPTINTIWEDDVKNDDNFDKQSPNAVFHFVAHLHKAFITIKVTETDYKTQKIIFRPIACVNLEGLFLDCAVRHPDWASIQMGVSAAQVVAADDCMCNGSFLHHENHPVLATVGSLGNNQMIYLDQSLFNVFSVENQMQRRDYNYEWEEHFQNLTEDKMLERSPCCSLDYFYHLTLPEDEFETDSSQSYLDLENSNLKERLMIRCVVGPSQLNVNGDFFHRFSKFIHSLLSREFEPYSNFSKVIRPNLTKPFIPTMEDAEKMEEFIPAKYYCLTVIRPMLCIFPTDHPPCDVTTVNFCRKYTKKKLFSEVNTSVQLEPIIIVQADRIEVQQVVPMYPKRVVQVAINLSQLSDNFLYYSQSHITGKLFCAEISLANMCNEHFDYKLNIIPTFGCTGYIKELQYPDLWKNPVQSKIELMLEVNRFSVRLTWPQVLLISSILNSWFQTSFEKTKFMFTNLPETAVSISNGYPTFDFSMDNWQCKYIKNDTLHFATACIGSCCVKLHHWVNDICHKVTLFHGPEVKENIHKVNFFNENHDIQSQNVSDDCVKLVMQFPSDMENSSEPAVFVLSVNGLSFYLDPALYTWIDYLPNILESEAAIPAESARKDEVSENSPFSSTVLTESQSLPKLDEENLSILKGAIQFCLRLFSFFKQLLIEVQYESISLILPISSPIDSDVSHVLQNVQTMFSQGILPDTLVINLPRITLCNGTQKQNLLSSLDDSPIYNIQGFNMNQDLFPWTLTMKDFSAYTLKTNKDSSYIINPLSLSATIALNFDFLFSKMSKINLCIHADNESVYIQLNDKQVEILANIIQISLDALSKLISRLQSALQLFALTGNKDNKDLSTDVSEKRATSLIDALSSEIQENKLEILSELPKLTVWAQWTLPKLTINLMSSDGHRLDLECDELGASLDVQEVYTKLKFTLTAFNWNHYQKDEFLNQYIPGPFKGIFFTCSDKLSRNICIPNPKNDLLDESTDATYGSDSMCKSKSSYTFLSINLTRVLSKSVQRRWSQLVCDNNDELESKISHSQSSFDRFVSEIDIKIRSFDCVLWFPVLLTGFRIIEPIFRLRFSLPNYPIQFSSKAAIESEGYQLKWINNNNLPLIYLNINTVRIFMPTNTTETELNHDMLIFQMKKLTITSQVENPLSRIILRSDIFALAQQARITHVPGSDVEDRQYQLDIIGINMSTGSWKELIKRSRVSEAPSVGSQLNTLGENPALEWNHKCLKLSNVESDLMCLPLMCDFNIRIVAAPAITYKQLKEDILIAGHSLELNFTTNFDLFLSFTQISLIYQICQENILHILEIFKEPLKQIQRQKSRTSKQDCDLSELDSGIEIQLDSGTNSELLVLPPQPNVVKSIISAKVIIEQQIHTNKWINWPINWDTVSLVPFEVLFTARSFTFTIYSDKLRLSASRINAKKESKNKKVFQKNENNDSDGYERSNEEVIKDETNVIIPIIYVALSQPHIFFQYQLTETKVDISCFDLIMKGSNDKVIIPVTSSKMLPNLEDFNVNWIETKAGDMNSRTGISPALFTISIKNFLLSQVDIEMSIDRPWKLNFSIIKYEQMLDYIKILNNITTKSTPTSNSITSVLQLNKKRNADVFSSLSTQKIIEKFRYLLTSIRSVSFKTVQVMTIFETIPHKQNAHILLAWDEVSGNICFKDGGNNLIDELSYHLCINNLYIKLAYNKKLRSLLQPCCANINFDLIWDFWNKYSNIPRIYFNIELEAMLLSFGRESWLCLNKILSHLDEFLKKYNSQEIKNVKKNTTSESQLEKFDQMWYDDLRVGRFQYIQDSDGVGLQPGPNEIVFCKEQVGQSARMSWCYPEPRVLTRVEIYPVPFRSTGTTEQNENRDEVNCMLQYWDTLTRSYVNCQVFQLSESQQCNLNLPAVLPIDSKTKLFISHQWRVVLDYYKPTNESEEPIMRKSLVSPLALAACMRVDSYFNSDLIPKIQSRLAVDVLQLSLSNHLFQSKDAPLLLNTFSFDNTIPQDQDFLVINAQNNICIGHSWKTWHKLEIKTIMSCDLLEYRALTLRTFTEPCSLKGEVVYLSNQKPPVIDGILHGDSLHIYLGQSAIHTLYFASQIFLQPSYKVTEQFLLNHYVICNDTQETIRFGQVDTDEIIILHSRKMHAYSWRSLKNKQLLHVCIDGMKWKWCDVFAIDKLGVETRTMEQKGQKVTLIIKVKKYNKSQKQIIICGQLIFASRLDLDLEIKLFSVFNTSPEDIGIGKEKLILLDRNCTAASCLYESGTRRGFQICLPGENWSDEIYFPQKSLRTDSIVVKVSFKKDQFLHVICHFFTERIGASCQILVLFVPMYIIQTDLPGQIDLMLLTPKENENQSFRIDGCGQEFQLHRPGCANVTHQVLFKHWSESDSSQPSLQLSTNMINQVTKLPHPKIINIEEMCCNWMSNHSILWPYDDDDFEKKMRKLPLSIVNSVLKSREIPLKKAILPKMLPNIKLQVSTTQRWPACNTILIQVKPWGLIINKSTIDLLITIDGVDWNIEKEEIFATPNIKEFIKLGIIHDSDAYYSDPLQITSEDWSVSHYWPKVINSIPLNGTVKCNIKIKKGHYPMLCCLTLSSKLRNGIRLFRIQPAFNIVNKTKERFKLATFSTIITEHKFNLQPQSTFHSQLKSKTELERNILNPLLFWQTYDPEDMKYESSEEFRKYISFCLLNETSNASNWSLPCCVNGSSANSRICFTVPISIETAKTQSGVLLMTMPFILTLHTIDKINYLVIHKDNNPQLLIHNLCQIPIYYGQNIPHSSNGFQIAEESELVNCLPMVQAMTACHYTFPEVSKRFPEIYDIETMPKLHLASASFEAKNAEEEECLIWSRGVDVMFEGELFLSITNCGDVKIHIERIGHTMYVYIDPVSRVEVSAKEIREQIESAEHVSVTSKSRIPSMKKRSPEQKMEKKGNCFAELARSRKPIFEIHQDPFVYQQVYFKQSCLIILDDSFYKLNVSEVARVTGENIIAVFRPTAETNSNTKQIHSRIKYDVFTYVGQIQIDNQMFNQGNFDYRVISIPQTEWSEKFDDDMPMEIILQKLKTNAFLKVECTLENNCLQTILVAVKPTSVFAEDLYFSKLYTVMSKFIINPAFHTKFSNLLSSQDKLPLRAVIMSGVYSSPFQCASMVIESFDVKMSIRSSMKLDISLVEVPLSFTRLEKQFIMTSFDRIGNAVTMHYITGALFKAGWVVGSVDLLGNPGGFARSLGSGVADFFLLPCNGFFYGPWAFCMGMANGTISLFRQFSAGSLCSITSWANSISRNMERLSLDEEYYLQNEEYRRHKPDSLTEGITQGLSGFGISILAGIAGIVDQPIQSLQKAIEQRAPTAAVTGLVSGVGKGLVGVVAKPIAGAAEFIAQAGQGILYGTGWSKVLIQKFEPIMNLIENSRNSKVKYEWKMLASLENVQVICAFEAMQYTNEHYLPCVLLLTSKLLFVVNVDDDSQQQVFGFNELDCHGPLADPTLVHLTPVQKELSASILKSNESSQDRIADFVNKLTLFTTSSVVTSSNSESLSDLISHVPSDSPDSCASCLKFFINPSLRNSFISLYKTSKRIYMGKGFLF